MRQAGDERSWQIFVRCDVNGEPTAEVARSLQMSYHAVYVARKRVRARLAREGARLRRVPAPVCDPDEPEDAP